MNQLSKKLGFLFVLTLFFQSNIFAIESVSQLEVSDKTKPLVLVSIKPILGLVKALLLDDVTVDLISHAQNNPHSCILSAKDLKRITAANLVVWVGSAYEMGMQKILQSAVPDQQLVTLQRSPKLKLLEKRKGVLFPDCGCDHDHAHHHHHDDKSHHHHHDEVLDQRIIDGHFWLKVDNAILLVEYLSSRFSKTFQSLREKIEQRKRTLIQKLLDLKQDLNHLLLDVKDQLAYIDHDCLAYWEDQYGFKIQGVLLSDEGTPSSLKHLHLIMDEFERNKEEGLQSIVFYEKILTTGTTPVFQKIQELYPVHTVEIDYTGHGVQVTSENMHQLYFIILKNLALQLKNGFQKKTQILKPLPIKR